MRMNKTLIQYQMEIQSVKIQSYAYDVEDEKTKKEQIVVDGNTIRYYSVRTSRCWKRRICSSVCVQ